MNFTIRGDVSVEASGNVQISLPDDFFVLQQDIIDEIFEGGLTNNVYVLAVRRQGCGIEFIREDGTLWMCEEKLPEGTPSIIDHGMTVLLGDDYEIPSEWLVEHSSEFSFI